MITAREARVKSGMNTIIDNELAIVETAVLEAIEEGYVQATIEKHEFCDGIDKETNKELKRLGYTVTYDNLYEHYDIWWWNGYVVIL